MKQSAGRPILDAVLSRQGWDSINLTPDGMETNNISPTLPQRTRKDGAPILMGGSRVGRLPAKIYHEIFIEEADMDARLRKILE